MSGIEEIKKKAKLSLDEMFDSQTVGKLETQKDGNPEKKEAGQPYNHTNNQPSVHKDYHPSIQTPTQKDVQEDKNKYSEKMTFNLTKEAYKVFNDIYARRMLAGRKTEKSSLICEAIKLLEEKEGY